MSLNSDRRLYQDEIEELVGEMTSYISNNLEHSLRAGNSSTLKFVFHPGSWKLEPEHKDNQSHQKPQPQPVVMDSVSSLLVFVPSTVSPTAITPPPPTEAATTTTTMPTISVPGFQSQVPNRPQVIIKEWSHSNPKGSIEMPSKTNRETAILSQIPNEASLIHHMDPMEHLQHQSNYIQQLSMQDTHDSEFWIKQGFSENAMQARPSVVTMVPQRTQVPFVGTPFQRFDSTWSPYKPTASHGAYKPTAPAMLLEPPSIPLKKPLRTSEVFLPQYHPLRPTYSPKGGTSMSKLKPILAPLLTLQPIKGYRPTVKSSQFHPPNPQGSSSSKYKPTIKPTEGSATIKSETMAHSPSTPGDLGGSVSKYKPTNRPEPLLTTSGFFMLTAGSTQSDLPLSNQEKVTFQTTKTISTTTTTTTTRSTTSATSTTTTSRSVPESNGISTIRPNEVVEVNLYDLVEHFVLGFDQFLRQVLNGGLGKTVNSLTAALRETFNGRNSLVNLLIVFGIPTATAGLTFMGMGPMAVALAAWMVPMLSVVVIPDLVANDNVERTRSFLT